MAIVGQAQLLRAVLKTQLRQVLPLSAADINRKLAQSGFAQRRALCARQQGAQINASALFVITPPSINFSALMWIAKVSDLEHYTKRWRPKKSIFDALHASGEVKKQELQPKHEELLP
jgi:hypothetical protein